MLRNMALTSNEPKRLAALLHLVDHDLGFAMSGRIQQTKAELSTGDLAAFRFTDGPIDIAVPVTPL